MPEREIPLMDLMSVVITAYNLSGWIGDSVRSVLEQSYPHLECIVVDDGSEDETLQILESLAARDPRVKVIAAPHRGVSHARNLGLEAAKGAYIVFLDGDDTLDADCLLRCTQLLRAEPDTDLLIFGIRYLAEDGAPVREAAPPPLRFEDGRALADWYIVHQALLLYSAGNKLYRTDALRENAIAFREGCDFGEDRMFNYEFLRFCGPIRAADACFYNYRHINAGSLSTRFRPCHIRELLALHRAKTDCMLSLSVNTTEEERAAFIRADAEKEARRAFDHIGAHAGELDGARLMEEYRTLLTLVWPLLGKQRGAMDGGDCAAIIGQINGHLFPCRTPPELSGFDTVLILGSAACDYRVREALRLFSGLSPDYVCSGGNVSVYTDAEGRPLTEAAYMRQILLENGIGAAKIRLDEQARYTWENIFNLRDVIAEKQVCVVTAGFHVKRVEQILAKLGLKAAVLPAYGPHTREDNWYKSSAGISVILTELEKLDPDYACEAARELLGQLCRIGRETL